MVICKAITQAKGDGLFWYHHTVMRPTETGQGAAVTRCKSTPPPRVHGGIRCGGWLIRGMVSGIGEP